MERLVAAPRSGLRAVGVDARVVEREHTVKVQAPTPVGSEHRARAREARTAEGRPRTDGPRCRATLREVVERREEPGCCAGRDAKGPQGSEGLQPRHAASAATSKRGVGDDASSRRSAGKTHDPHRCSRWRFASASSRLARFLQVQRYACARARASPGSVRPVLHRLERLQSPRPGSPGRGFFVGSRRDSVRASVVGAPGIERRLGCSCWDQSRTHATWGSVQPARSGAFVDSELQPQVDPPTFGN